MIMNHRYGLHCKQINGPRKSKCNVTYVGSGSGSLSTNKWQCPPNYYAALLPRRGPHIASHSVCLSVRLSVCLSVRPVIERHVVPPSELQ